MISRFADLWTRYVAPATPLLPEDTPSVPLTVYNTLAPSTMRVLSLFGVRDLLEQKARAAPQRPRSHRGLRRSRRHHLRRSRGAAADLAGRRPGGAGEPPSTAGAHRRPGLPPAPGGGDRHRAPRAGPGPHGGPAGDGPHHLLRRRAGGRHRPRRPPGRAGAVRHVVPGVAGDRERPSRAHRRGRLPPARRGRARRAPTTSCSPTTP